MAKGEVVLKYMGKHGEQWSCVPARDLTEKDMKRIVEVVRGPSVEDILRLAKTVDDKQLYVAQKQKRGGKKNGNDA